MRTTGVLSAAAGLLWLAGSSALTAFGGTSTTEAQWQEARTTFPGVTALY